MADYLSAGLVWSPSEPASYDALIISLKQTADGDARSVSMSMSVSVSVFGAICESQISARTLPRGGQCHTMVALRADDEARWRSRHQRAETG